MIIVCTATVSFTRDAANCSICFANVEAFRWQNRQNAPLLQFWQGCQSPLKAANLVKVLPRQNFYSAAAVLGVFQPFIKAFSRRFNFCL